jgi:hypothetical protein
MNDIVSNKYSLYLRNNGIYYLQDRDSGEQSSLRTRDIEHAERLLFAKNEAQRDTRVSREVGMTYLATAGPGAAERDWDWVLNQIMSTKSDETLRRWKIAAADDAYDLIRNVKLVDTRAEDFLAVMNSGTVSTNVYLRRMHNFALDLGWLPRTVICRRQWPKVKHEKKRAITWEEHCRILEREHNPERRDYYELLWHTGASQGDGAQLKAEDADWHSRTLRFFRAKTGTVVNQSFADGAAEILKRLPKTGYLFPDCPETRVPSQEFADLPQQFSLRLEWRGVNSPVAQEEIVGGDCIVRLAGRTKGRAALTRWWRVFLRPYRFSFFEQRRGQSPGPAS